ncbi:MAG TPA: type II secretion system secretin GspD [Desulfuromonadales bacterium]|nr:type II secretion system secretin GspD [Desulfuromonadales bacterium]
MTRKFFPFFGILLICLVAGGSGRALAAQPQKAAAKTTAGKVSLDFKDIDLRDFIQTISELTGRNFIYDDSVKGKVTISSPHSMTLGEAYKAFLTVLNLKGYTVVPSGKVNKIVSTRDAKENNLPILTGRQDHRGEEFVTRLIPLKNVDASVLASSVLSPLVPKTSNIVAYPPTNTLIISDSAANIDRLVKIIKQLDVPNSLDNLQTFSLKYADADEVAKICNQVIAQSATSPRRRRAAFNVRTAGGQEVSKVIPYKRTNMLVVLANSEDLSTVRNIIRELDQPPTQARGHINVYYLENADAETLAKTLNEIVTGMRAQTSGTRTAGRAAAAALSNEKVSITADKPTNALIINAAPEDYDIIKGIIKQLDIKRKQVFVEALILELSMDATKDLGASLQGAIPTGDNGVAFGTSNLNSGTSLSSLIPSTSTDSSGNVTSSSGLLSQAISGIMVGGLFHPISTTINGQAVTIPALSALINLSKSDSNVNILSAPSLLTSDNKEAEILVGQNVPIITSRLTDAVGSSSSSSTGLAQSVSVERKDVALDLKITPQITEGNLIRLKVDQEITDLAASSVGNVDQVGPTFTKRLLKNTVLAENGKTIVLGGLISTNKQVSVTKVPLLGDIPVLGWLFKTKNITKKKTNLLIFITPKIVNDANDLARVTRESKQAMDRFQKSGITPKPKIEPPAPKPAAKPAPAFPSLPQEGH